jgi:hypothetical protein
MIKDVELSHYPLYETEMNLIHILALVKNLMCG